MNSKSIKLLILCILCITFIYSYSPYKNIERPNILPDKERIAEHVPQNKNKDERSTNKLFTVGFSMRWGDIAFCTTIMRGAKDCSKVWEQEHNYDVQMLIKDVGNENPQLQIDHMKELYKANIDGLLLFPGDSKIVSETLVDTYNENNVPVVITDIGVDKGDFVSMIITENYKGGEKAARVLADVLPHKAKVIVLNHGMGNNNARLRAHGFTSKSKALGLNVLPQKIIKLNEDDARIAMEEVLEEYPDISGVFTLNDEPALGVVRALKNAKNTNCRVVTFDINDITLEWVKSGLMEACIVQDPYYIGYEGMNQLMYKLTGQENKINKLIDAPTTICTKENAYEYENNPQVKLKSFK